MNATCLINNHNYVRYVGEAVESALRQSRPFDRIIVVDDGSTDGSQDFLKRRFQDHPQVSLLLKDHGGQLSCFNQGILEVETDLVFFLDADDCYQTNYAEVAVSEYERQQYIDFLSVQPRVFRDGEPMLPGPSCRSRDMGLTTLGALFGGQCIGGVTSCLSMKTSTAKAALPYPHEAEWITRADDVLCFGSSLVGAYKRHLGMPLVDYRVHAANHFTGRRFGDAAKLRWSLAVNRMLGWYARQQGYDLASLGRCLHREFRTRQNPSVKELRAYLRIAMQAKLPLSVRFLQLAAITSHYVAEWRSVAPSDPPAATPFASPVVDADTSSKAA